MLKDNRRIYKHIIWDWNGTLLDDVDTVIDAMNNLLKRRKLPFLWDEEQEKWFFSIIDVIEVLTGTDRPRKYWSDLKSIKDIIFIND